MYCSLACYKSPQHGQCSESFYKENVIQEMALIKDDQQAEQSSKKMMEILKRLGQTGWQEGLQSDEDEGGEEHSESHENRFEEIDSDDGEDVPELADRLGGVNLNDADAIWERLTEEERKEFQGLLDSGDIGQILPEAEPWWLVDFKVELVQATSSKKLCKGERDLLDKCPPVKRNINNFPEISSKAPSPLTRFNLVNVLAAYAFVYRHFNGDFEVSPQEASNYLISISGNLKQNTIYESEPMAVESVCHECRQEQLPADKETSLLLKRDVQILFDGPANCGQKYRKHFLLSALSDIHRLLDSSKKKTPSENVSKGVFSSRFNDGNVGDLKYLKTVKVKSCLKKIDYMLSYAKDHL